MLKTNRSQSIYASESFVVSISSSPDGNMIVSGHLDQTLMTYNLEMKQKGQKIRHSCIPYALAWGHHILAAGNDCKVIFYESTGDRFAVCDGYAKDEKVKEFTCAAFNNSGMTAIVGNYNRFYMFTFNQRRPQWDETLCKQIDNYYSVTACAWKHDGAQLAIGSLCGSVDVFNMCMKKANYKGKFEITHVSPNHVIVKKIGGEQRLNVKSRTTQEVHKINIYQDRYIVAQTMESLLLGDVENGKLSEIHWRGSGNEKFDFSSSNIVMVFNAGELTIVEYGNDEPIGTCRTENMGPNMISARLSEVTDEEKANGAI